MNRVIYPFMKVWSSGENPNLKELMNVPVKDSIKYLLIPGNMEGKYLGACLDSCRWGSMTSVAWPMNLEKFMDFIDKWRKENNDDESLYHERAIGELYSRFELPHINYDRCPRNEKHKGNFVDAGGRVRCSHRSINCEIKPSFTVEDKLGFDEFSQMPLIYFHENTPSAQRYQDDEGNWIYSEDEYKEYLKHKEKYDEENAEKVVDVCYSIISDTDIILPFQTILERLNMQSRNKIVYCWDVGSNKCKRLDELSKEEREFSSNIVCFGHNEVNNMVEFPFDGWDMAYYLLKWKQQSGNPPWFSGKSESWYNTNSRRFVRIFSED